MTRSRRDPTSGGARPAASLNTFRTVALQTGTAVQTMRRGLVGVQAPVRTMATRAAATAPALRQLRTATTQAGRSVRRTGTSAVTAATRIRAGATRIRGPLGVLGALASGAGVFGSVTDLLGSHTPQITKFMTLFGTAMTLGSIAMTAINTAMKANPLGFILGVLTPLVAYLVDYAVNSSTGQKVIQQVFQAALDGFKVAWAFMAPVIEGWAKTVSEVFDGVQKTVGSVLKTLGSTISAGINGAKNAISAATHAVTSIVKGAWNGFKGVIQPVLNWLAKTLPSAFTRVRDAMSKTLHGMGNFLSTGIQTVAGVITGPVKGLIAFANWIIDGLNHLSFSFFGKKFGVHLSKIPQLAEGGVVLPAAVPGASAVQPLSSLGRFLPAPSGASATTGPAFFAGRPGARVYEEREGSSPLTIADDLLFLHRTAA
ncbi:hypothetical protein OG285_14790 [Streptomyces sp. NBC_01471]|uniref:hypothetical protein n=1 Tax=Streptomyces sp. NBC_01471 TaxID=2903879 RepID=UPI00324FD6C7